jgi:hypothetical protein
MIAFHSIRPVFVTFTINPVKIFIQVFQWRTLHHHTPFPYRLCGKRRQSETDDDRYQYGSPVAAQESRY